MRRWQSPDPASPRRQQAREPRRSLKLSKFKAQVPQYVATCHRKIFTMRVFRPLAGVQIGAPTQNDNSLRAKARQTRNIEQLREVFLTNGRLRVREQAKLLGLCPSTAHAVLQRNYKNSGLGLSFSNGGAAHPRCANVSSCLASARPLQSDNDLGENRKEEQEV